MVYVLEMCCGVEWKGIPGEGLAYTKQENLKQPSMVRGLQTV